MRLEDIRQCVLESSFGDWAKLMDGEVFLRFQRLKIESSADTLGSRLDQDGHHASAVYRADVDLSLNYGLTFGSGESHFDWDIWPGHDARMFYVDVLWRGVPVERHVLVFVHEARAILPLPTPEMNTASIAAYHVTTAQRDLARLVHGIEGSPGGFEDYFDWAAFELRG